MSNNIDDFDEAMKIEGKEIKHNTPYVKESCNTCQWNLTTEGHNKQRDMMCRNCSLAYTSNWTKKEYHGN
mgnify:CR=1 FL=1